jgi:SSS family solute:Na+ symporter
MFTIPEKIGSVYGEKIGLISALLIFILVSPAPYLLMIANLISLIFGIDTLPALFAGLIISIAYLFKGGYKSDLYTDALEFFIMFAGFAILFFVSSSTTGGYDFLESNLPSDHLSLTGNTSVTFLIVWFLIALWTFTDPGFHQRCYAARTPNVAKYGILISIILWAVFDFLTTSTGLFARAVLPNLNNPVLAFPLLAERVLGSGFKGIFYAALFATILSTLNSFLFLSATTISRDFIWKVKRDKSDEKLIKYTRIGLFLTGIISLLLAYSIQSVIEIWYTIGSICIPGIILLVFSSYFEKIRISKHIAIYETLAAVASSLIWLLIRTNVTLHGWLGEIEPMIIGMLFASTVHIYGLSKRKTIAL